MRFQVRRVFFRADGVTSVQSSASQTAAWQQDEELVRRAYRPAHHFRPRKVVHNGAVQTILARRAPPDSVAQRLEQPMLLDAGHDDTNADPDRPVRLLGYYNPPLSNVTHRGLVLLIHGWHGSSHSSDLLYIADTLLRSGFSTFRLNLRDHGPNLHADSLALNRGLFLATLLDEVVSAAQQVATLARGAPFSMIGGSMGGNFVLRLAERHNESPFPGLTKVIALCPAIDPSAAVDALDRQSAYRTFFRARWLQSLKVKQRHFPELYDFSPLKKVRRIREMTDVLVRTYGPWESTEEYFTRYTVDNSLVARLRVPTTVIAAHDDAVIPVGDIYRLEPHEFLTVQVHPTGGHMGFVDIFPYRRWLPQAVVEELRKSLS